MRILCFYPENMYPVYFWRGLGVMERLRKIDPSVDVFEPSPGWRSNPAGLWSDMLKADVVYFMKCFLPHHITALDFANRMKVPVWYDIDDDLFSVPNDNPAKRGITKELQENIRVFIRHADAVTVSTEALVEVVEGVTGRKKELKKLEVIPNALDDYTFSDWNHPVNTNTVLMTWRGGESHKMDLLAHTESFHHFLENTTDTKMLFLGHNPIWMTGCDPRFMEHPAIPDFYAWMRVFRDKIHPRAHVVPLVDNAFNRSKSAISAIEGIYAGALPIVPNWPEFQIPGALKYDSPEQVGKLMVDAMTMEESEWDIRRHQTRDLWLRDQRLLSKVNRKRIEVAKAVAK